MARKEITKLDSILREKESLRKCSSPIKPTTPPTLELILPHPRNINPLPHRAIFINKPLQTKQPPFENLCSHSDTTSNSLCLFSKHRASLTDLFARPQTYRARNKFKLCKSTNGYHVNKYITSSHPEITSSATFGGGTD